MDQVPEATTYRLSLYHCFLGELSRRDPSAGITSRVLADELQLREETVRRDISFIGNVGRPGAGYKAGELHAAIQKFLGLSDNYPTIRIGSAEMLRALLVVFPSHAWGVTPVGYYSEDPADVGQELEGIPVRHITEVPELPRSLGVQVALIAVSPPWVQIAVDLCAKAGIEGVLLLTPALKVERPDGVRVTHIRMPCDIKSLACRCSREPDVELT
jgi:redox-sensing transcriptional repressor